MITFEQFLNQVGQRANGIHLQSGKILPLLHAIAGSHPSQAMGEGFQPIRSRDFEPHEDDFRDVDFLETSITRKPTITDFETERQLTVEFLIKVGAETEITTQRADKVRLAAELAAALLKALASNGDLSAAHIFSQNSLERSLSVRDAHLLFKPLMAALYELGHQDLEVEGFWNTSLLKELQTLALSIWRGWAMSCGGRKPSKP